MAKITEIFFWYNLLIKNEMLYSYYHYIFKSLFSAIKEISTILESFLDFIRKKIYIKTQHFHSINWLNIIQIHTNFFWNHKKNSNYNTNYGIIQRKIVKLIWYEILFIFKRSFLLVKSLPLLQFFTGPALT